MSPLTVSWEQLRPSVPEAELMCEICSGVICAGKIVEGAANIPPMGRFAIRDMGQTVAAGLCLKVTDKK